MSSLTEPRDSFLLLKRYFLCFHLTDKTTGAVSEAFELA